ncbi:MAG: diphthine--ammonia ligase [archaeon]
MELAVLFSGGKDSCYALYKAMEKDEIACLISIISRNKESYMFHTPNIDITKLQAEAIGLPLIQKASEGKKEEELKELKEAIAEAKQKFKIEGIVTGAIESVYQSSRIQKICDELGLRCINPLWKKEQQQLLKELVEQGFKVMIVGVAAFPMGKEWLGRMIDDQVIRELVALREKHRISPSGEGGELETTVLDAPFFKKSLEVVESEAVFEHNAGVFIIKKARFVKK